MARIILIGPRFIRTLNQDYSLGFQNLNGSLLELTKCLNLEIQDLMFDVAQVLQKLNLDLQLYRQYTLLLHTHFY